MAREADPGLEQLVRQLLDRQAESRSLDYKAPIMFGPTRPEKGEILRDVMAFANTRDGGYILIGVEQSGGSFVPVGLSEAQAASFDPTDIGTFAQNYCSVLPKVTASVARIEQKNLLLLRVDEFGEEPIVCTRDLHDTNGKSLILRAGSIYVRTADARCMPIETGEAMRSFLDLAVQKRGDALLQQISRLVGAPPTPSGPVSPVDAYAGELDAAHKLYQREDLTNNYWYMELMPALHNDQRISSNARLKEIRRESAVSIRGWDFPHVDRDHNRAFEYGIESVTHWSRYHEAHRLYRSGLFAWRRQLAEDSAEQYKGAVSYLSSIYSLTEFFVFANRYASLVADSGDFVLRIGLTGLSGRVLRSEPDISMDEHATAAQRFDRTYQMPVEELRASHLELATNAAQQLFELFNVDISTDVISKWQRRFMERRL